MGQLRPIRRQKEATAVWATLSSPVHLAHYADDETGSDWSPMRRVVGALAARDYAPAVFAYTSMDVFCITFLPGYGHGVGWDSISLAFDSRTQLFFERTPVPPEVAQPQPEITLYVPGP